MTISGSRVKSVHRQFRGRADHCVQGKPTTSCTNLRLLILPATLPPTGTDTQVLAKFSELRAAAGRGDAAKAVHRQQTALVDAERRARRPGGISGGLLHGVICLDH
ncbi:hypothetical protein [Rhodanobacter soli]|uniref:hypothetical protein n=1 Tax=Rhodanobacter soli TaxID=590609 RepID=UPI003CE8DBF2